jgi:hypothetical protein
MVLLEQPDTMPWNNIDCKKLPGVEVVVRCTRAQESLGLSYSPGLTCPVLWRVGAVHWGGVGVVCQNTKGWSGSSWSCVLDMLGHGFSATPHSGDPL